MHSQLFRSLTNITFSLPLVPFLYVYVFYLKIRVTLYIHWALGVDEESQRKGIVGIICWPSITEAVSPDKFAIVYSPRELPQHINLSNRMFECMPVRIAGVHVCLPDKPIYQMLRSGIALSMRGFSSRLKFHCGKRSLSQMLCPSCLLLFHPD